MAIKRRDVVLPVGTTPDIVTESPAGHSKPSTGSYYNKPGSGLISSCNSRNARIIAAGILVVLMVVFGTRYVYPMSSRTTTHTLTHFIPTTTLTPTWYITLTHIWYITHTLTSYLPLSCLLILGMPLIHQLYMSLTHHLTSRPLYRQLSPGDSLSVGNLRFRYYRGVHLQWQR